MKTFSYRVPLQPEKWYKCQTCKGTHSLYEQGDLHKSSGTIPCPHCNKDGMITTESISSDEYFNRFINKCEITLRNIFGKSDNDVNYFHQYIFDIISDDTEKLRLMHNEPLYIVADYLGISDSEVDSDEILFPYLALPLVWESTKIGKNNG